MVALKLEEMQNRLRTFRLDPSTDLRVAIIYSIMEPGPDRGYDGN